VTAQDAANWKLCTCICIICLSWRLESFTFWCNTSNRFISPVRIEPVSDPSEIPALASVFDTAILASGDNFRELLKRYVGDLYTEVEKRLGAALSSAAEGTTEQHFVLKAVKTVPRSFPGDDNKRGAGNPDGASREMPTKEIIVGMAYWTIGYTDIPKVNPFERPSASAPASVVGDESAEKARLEEAIVAGVETANAPEHEPSFDFYAVCRKPVRNTYISQIRGKKHVCKYCSRFQNPRPRSIV
jgi:hypothetical protein